MPGALVVTPYPAAIGAGDRALLGQKQGPLRIEAGVGGGEAGGSSRDVGLGPVAWGGLQRLDHVAGVAQAGGSAVGHVDGRGAEALQQYQGPGPGGIEAGVVRHGVANQAAADQDRVVKVEGVEQGGEVGHEVEGRVGAGMGGAAVAPGVEGQHR